jgi:hypothetical protein
VGLPVLGGLAGREWYRVGRFLGPSISAHYDRYPLPTTVDAWLRAGVADAGAQFRNDIVEGPGGKQILLQDPCGNVVELFQPANA